VGVELDLMVLGMDSWQRVVVRDVGISVTLLGLVAWDFELSVTPF